LGRARVAPKRTGKLKHKINNVSPSLNKTEKVFPVFNDILQRKEANWPELVVHRRYEWCSMEKVQSRPHSHGCFVQCLFDKDNCF
jgi:hypothetical protein